MEIGPRRPRRLVVHRTYFLEDEIVDGDYYNAPHTYTRTDYYPVEPSRWDDEGDTPISKARAHIIDIGVTENAGSWFSDPDGSYITNYGTAERCETSAHPEGFSDAELDELFAPFD